MNARAACAARRLEAVLEEGQACRDGVKRLENRVPQGGGWRLFSQERSNLADLRHQLRAQHQFGLVQGRSLTSELQGSDDFSLVPGARRQDLAHDMKRRSDADLIAVKPKGCARCARRSTAAALMRQFPSRKPLRAPPGPAPSHLPPG